MATITQQTTAVTGNTITAAIWNAEFANIINDYNGNITNANISASAGIALSKLASTPVAYADTRSKVITSSRDMTAATGNVAYTGVGFIPTSIIVYHFIGDQAQLGIGMVDSAKGSASMEIRESAGTLANPTSVQAAFIYQSSSGGNVQSAVVATFDADGFTLTWTKTASPTGTLRLMFLCYR